MTQLGSQSYYNPTTKIPESSNVEKFNAVIFEWDRSVKDSNMILNYNNKM